MVCPVLVSIYPSEELVYTQFIQGSACFDGHSSPYFGPVQGHNIPSIIVHQKRWWLSPLWNPCPRSDSLFCRVRSFSLEPSIDLSILTRILAVAVTNIIAMVFEPLLICWAVGFVLGFPLIMGSRLLLNLREIAERDQSGSYQDVNLSVHERSGLEPSDLDQSKYKVVSHTCKPNNNPNNQNSPK